MQGKAKITDAVSFICPNCGGTIKHDIKTDEFLCSSCRANFDFKTLSDKVKEHSFNEYRQRESACIPFSGMEMCECHSCGAEIVFDKDQMATVCSMCGSSNVSVTRQKHGIPPEGLIPFKIDRQDAAVMFSKWVKSRWFAPNDFKKSYQAGNLEGVYMPFWTFDAHADARYYGEGGTDTTVTDKDGKSRTETHWTKVSGRITTSFDDVLVCAATGQSADIVEGVLPFDTINNTRPFVQSYLSGYKAEIYSIKADKGFDTAKKKMESRIEDMAEAEILRKYDHARVNNVSAVYSSVTYKYVLLPVYSSVFGYNGKPYAFVINGETGKVNGNRPYSKWKITAAVVAALIAAITIFIFVNTDDDGYEYAKLPSETYTAQNTFHCGDIIDTNINWGV